MRMACCTISPARFGEPADRNVQPRPHVNFIGRALPRRGRCAASRIATRRRRRSMSAARKFWPCAISRQNSVARFGRDPVIVGREEPTEWRTTVAGRKRVRHSDRRHPDQTGAWDRGLGVARSMTSSAATKYEVRDGRTKPVAISSDTKGSDARAGLEL